MAYSGFGFSRSDKFTRIGNRVRRREKKHKSLSNPYFYELVNQYRDAILELKKPSTRVNWTQTFTRMNEDFGHLKMDKLDRRTIQMYFTQLSKRISASSVESEWVALSALLNYAKREGIIEGFTKPELPKKYRNQQEWVSIEQIHALLDHSFGRMHLLVMVLAETGCRIGEALGLQNQDVNLTAKQLSILRTIFQGKPNSPKTQSSIRTLAISDELCDNLNSLMFKNPKAYVFSVDGAKPWNVLYLREKFLRLCDKAQVPRVGFHALRRGNITHLVEDLGMPESVVGRRVGHLSQGMTLGVYVQAREGRDKQWIGKIAETLYGRKDGLD